MTSKKKNQNFPPTIIDVRKRGTVRGISPATVKKRASKILDALSLSSVELSLVLCDDAFIQQLNRDFRAKDTPTDVLSFPQLSDRAPTQPLTVLGDVVISVETAARQASSRGHSLRTEVTTLLVHGVLHLMGHTHENDTDEAVMNREAARLLAHAETSERALIQSP